VFAVAVAVAVALAAVFGLTWYGLAHLAARTLVT